MFIFKNKENIENFKILIIYSLEIIFNYIKRLYKTFYFLNKILLSKLFTVDIAHNYRIDQKILKRKYLPAINQSKRIFKINNLVLKLITMPNNFII